VELANEPSVTLQGATQVLVAAEQTSPSWHKVLPPQWQGYEELLLPSLHAPKQVFAEAKHHWPMLRQLVVPHTQG
jgi:hypothetical protein